DHFDLGLAEILDQLTGFIGGGVAFAGRLDHLATLFRLLAQGDEPLHASVRRTDLRWRRRWALERRAGTRRRGSRRERGSADDGCRNRSVDGRKGRAIGRR